MLIRQFFHHVQVASHLLNPNEKEEMVQLVDTMLAFGLLYKHSKPSHFTSKTVYGGELQGVLVLDPPIDSLVKFKVGLLLLWTYAL